MVTFFQPVQGEKFDLIFWNIPFCYLDTEAMKDIGIDSTLNVLERSIFNPDYKWMHEYLSQGFDYLNEKGRLLLGFSPTIGRNDKLEEILEELGLEKIIVHEDIVKLDNETEALQVLEFRKSGAKVTTR
jgi:methylase of polypeptide subunit release factors